MLYRLNNSLRNLFLRSTSILGGSKREILGQVQGCELYCSKSGSSKLTDLAASHVKPSGFVVTQPVS